MADLILLTGGTGLVGNAIASALVERGHRVRALVRSVDRARTLLPPACELVTGDVTDPASVERAMAGCRVVYHAAGLPEQWLPDERTFERVNVGGTRTMIAAAQAARVARFVYTSTIDVFAWTPGTPFDESIIDPRPKGTAYERSKQAADRLVAEAVTQGLPAVFLHPSAVYGPVPAGSPGLNNLIADLAAGRVPMLLSGTMPVVYAPDVGLGHLRAEERPVGSRYILSESTWPLVELARTVCSVAGRRRMPRVMPSWTAHGLAAVGGVIARIIRRPPLLARGQLHFLESGADPQADRARAELGWAPTAFRDALPATLAFLARGS